MQKPNLSKIKWSIILFVIAMAIIAADQLTKLWIKSILAPGQSIPETGLFRLTHAQNTGAAFSIFHGRADILAIVSMIGVILLLFYTFYAYRHFPFLESRLNRVSVGMILGGTVGNLIDRVSRGYVIDFIDIGPWPVMNIADMCITTGVIIFAYSILFLKHNPDYQQHRQIQDKELESRNPGHNRNYKQ